jgi:pimeloyl-ACP methyl ester carboxylesterase
MDKKLTWEGNEIFYRTEGEGEPVMLVHGFGEDGTVWDRQVSFLQSKCRLIVPDLPGSGRSTMDANAWTIERLAASMNAVLLHENTGKCTMIGHSMGGYITLAFAEKFGGRLNGYVLFHSTAFADSNEKKQARKKGIEFISEHGGFAFLKTSVAGLFSEITKNERPELVEGFLSSLNNFSGQALVSYYEAMIARKDRTDILLKTGLDVMFIMGKYDQAVPLKDTLEQCHLPEKTYIHILHRSGHMGMLEETNASNLVLEKFIARNELTRKHIQ